MEKRMAGPYEIIGAVEIGSREVVLGVDKSAKKDQKYMCAYAEKNEFFQKYEEVMVSDEFPEIVKMFGERITEEAVKVQQEIASLGIPTEVITLEDCIPDSRDQDINGKVIAIKSGIFRPEYQRADRQLYLVKGGFGAYGNSRGNAVYCQNLYDGKETRFERGDVLGEVKPEKLPEWAEKGLEALRKSKTKEAER